MSQFHIEFFPVRYPRNFNPDTAPNVSRRGGGNCSKEIGFGDSFPGDRRGGRFSHDAIDIFGAVGLEIIAAIGGTVVDYWSYEGQEWPGAGESHDGGNFVRMMDEHGFVHYYAHLRDRPLVSSGQTVVSGQLLGYLGRTGYSACPHLHYQVRRPAQAEGRYSLNGYSTRGGGPENPYTALTLLCRGRRVGTNEYRIPFPERT